MQTTLNPGLPEAIGQVLGEGTGLQTDLMDRLAERVQAADQIRYIRRHGALEANLTLVINDADRH